MKKLALLGILAAFLMIGTACKDKSPAGVCDHAATIVDDEEAKDKEKCVKMMEEIKKELGDEKWDKLATCVLDASDEDGAEKCFKEAMK